MHSPARRVFMLLLPALFCLLLAVTLLAPKPVRAQTSDLDKLAREIALGLRCPVCQNLSVADSPAPLAVEMRGIIRRKLEAGESREAIMQYFVSSYGEGILLDPPRQGFTLLVWLGAVVSVVGGLFFLGMRLRAALSPETAPTGQTDRDDVPLDDAERHRYEARLDAELALRRQGGL